jgi:sugar-specific transcriptional regulator TrmB
MNVRTLQNFGLTEPQAKAYICLVKSGSLTAKSLAEKIKEGRTNTYMVLDRLLELGLVAKVEDRKVLRFCAANPVQLQNLAESKRREVLAHEKAVKDAMPALLSYYYTYQNQPGIRFFQGLEGITKMYEDQRRTMADIYFMRADSNVNPIRDVLLDHIEKRTRLGIVTHSVEPYGSQPVGFAGVDDRKKRDITWLPNGTFTAPVNVYIYGEKVALMSHGEEVFGSIIESPQLAVAFKQIFNLVRVAAPVLMREYKRKGTVQALLDTAPGVK